MASSLREVIAELDRQKQAYHEKIMSVDGEFSLLLRSFQVYDLFGDLTFLLVPQFNWGALSLALTFGLNLYELQPLNLEFTYRLPTVEEWLRGVKIVLEAITPEFATDLPSFVLANFEPVHAESVLEAMTRKCVFDQSRYDQCYYDPQLVRELLRSTLLGEVKKHPYHGARRLSLESLGSTAGLNMDVVRSSYNRIQLLTAMHTECFTLDYSVLDMARLCEEEAGSGERPVVRYVDFDGNPVEVTVYNLVDAVMGCILDQTALDYCYLLPDEDPLVHPEVAPGVPGSPPVAEQVWGKALRARDRIMLQATAVSNYATGLETADYHAAERTTVWGELQAMRYAIEGYVKGFLAREAPGLDQFTQRMYVTAVLQLWGHIAKRHAWGYRAYPAMTDEELRRWWVDYWSGQGLNPSILDKLFTEVVVWLRELAGVKRRLGERVRRRRLQHPPTP
jgi:hypothetical protein